MLICHGVIFITIRWPSQASSKASHCYQISIHLMEHWPYPTICVYYILVQSGSAHSLVPLNRHRLVLKHYLPSVTTIYNISVFNLGMKHHYNLWIIKLLLILASKLQILHTILFQSLNLTQNLPSLLQHLMKDNIASCFDNLISLLCYHHFITQPETLSASCHTTPLLLLPRLVLILKIL